MKVCLDSRLSLIYLKKADEIKVQYRDIKTVEDLIMDYPDKTIIIQIPFGIDEPINWDKIEQWNKLSKNNVIVCLSKPADSLSAQMHNIRWYMGYYVTSYAELLALNEAGAYYAKIGTPLCFELDTIKNMELNIKLRMVPNIAYEGFPRVKTANGQWIRPEDLHLYDEYIEAIEFEQTKVSQEEALYRIYAEEHEWPGELGFIITGLTEKGLNRLIGSEVSQKRLNCGQRCTRGSNCHICDRALQLADYTKLKEYFDTVKKD